MKKTIYFVTASIIIALLSCIFVEIIFQTVPAFYKLLPEDREKTYLYIKALEAGNVAEREQLLQLFAEQPQDNKEKIENVKAIFCSTGADVITRKAIEDYTNRAFATLDRMPVSAEKKAELKTFGENLMQRNV